MTNVFIQIINMSINAAWLVLAVVIFRLIFKKAPKYISVCLWALVGLRLILPISFETTLSLIPSAQTVPNDIIYSEIPMINSGVSVLNSSVNPIINEHFAPTPYNSVNPLQIAAEIGGCIWVSGIVLMLIYAFISYLRVYKTVREAIILKDNIYLSDRIQVPFILGIIRPKIYLPLGMSEEDTEFVLAHEEAHIKRKDYLWKPLGFLLLSVYWFNPIIWVAYILLCRDIEAACDQKVIKGIDASGKKAYSDALINLSAPRKFITACPLAFGETGIKSRLKSILSYKKPAFWVSVAAIVLSVILAVCFLTNPVKKRIVDIKDHVAYITLLDGVTEYEFTVPPYYFQNYFTEEEIKDITTRLLEIEISYSPISKSRDEERPKNYNILVRNGESLSSIHFNEDFTQVWIADGVKPSFSYKIFNPESVAELFNEYTENVYDYNIQLPAITNGEKLTLNHVIELSKKGDELSWKDFEKFAYIETGSGLYIRRYEIDEMFYLSVGGTNWNEDVLYIYLAANDGLEEVIDIRQDDVKGYINNHKNNPIVKNITAGWEISPVGYNDKIYNEVIAKWGMPKYSYLSSVKNYPVTKIANKKELDEFIADFEAVLDFDNSCEGYVSINSSKSKYTNGYFETNDLILTYVPSNNSNLRYNVNNVSKSQGELRVLVEEISVKAEKSVGNEGWIIAICVAKSDISDTESIAAQGTVASEIKHPAKTYVFRESEDVIKPTLSLFEGNEFTFTFSGISSYWGVGIYNIKEDLLVLQTSDGSYRYVFEIKGDELIFDAQKSSKELHFSGLYDGAVMK